MTSIWGELKRRNVVRVAVAYAIVGWILVEVTSTVLPIFEAPDWIVQVFTFFIFLGFPIALILSWAYELTPEGIKLERNVAAGESITKVTGRQLDFVIIGVLVIAVALFTVDRFVLENEALTPADVFEIQQEIADAIEAGLSEAEPDVLPNSVAVLLCDNLSPDPDDAWFAASIHDEILNQLVKIRALNVIARTSVLQYADAPPPISQIAEELNVEAVMECTVRYAGDAILVTAQLIDPETNSHLWSDTYPGDLSDLSTIFAMQADIAMNIANAVGAEFSLEEQASIEAVPTESPAAYELYLRARRRAGTLDGLRLSIQDLDAAIRLDPEFALAYAQRAWEYAGGLIYSQEVPVADYARNAVASAEQALVVDPTIGLAHSVIAAIDELNWRWTDARRRSELALELSPNDVYVLRQYVRFTRSAGEYDESIRVNERWAQLEPTYAGLYQQLAVGYRYARNYDASAAAAQKAIELSPATPSFHVHLAYADAARGNNDAAIRELLIAEQLFGGNFGQVFRVGQMAMAYSQVGRREDAERMFALLGELDLENPVGQAIWAQVYIALGNYDEALEQLEAAMDSPAAVNYTTLIEIKANPWAIPELDTPRFREILSGLWSVE